MASLRAVTGGGASGGRRRTTLVIAHRLSTVQHAGEEGSEGGTPAPLPRCALKHRPLAPFPQTASSS